MSTTTEYRSMVDPGLEQRPSPECSFCGSRLHNYGGVWNPLSINPNSPLKEVHCCRKCAGDVLPMLMADSIGDNELNPRQGKMFWYKAEKSFWYGVTSRLSRGKK